MCRVITYYMVEGSPHVWFTCTVINVQGWLLKIWWITMWIMHVRLCAVGLQWNKMYRKWPQHLSSCWEKHARQSYLCGWRMVFGWLFLEGGGEKCTYTWVTCGSHVAINVHSNYYYMVVGSPHMWLTCIVITTIWWRGALTCGSYVAINVHCRYYYMVEGSPHLWQLTCMVITTIRWRGALTCGSRVATNMLGNYYYMVEGSPHVWLSYGD